jgi:hypothetical protein
MAGKKEAKISSQKAVKTDALSKRVCAECGEIIAVKNINVIETWTPDPVTGKLKRGRKFTDKTHKHVGVAA